MDLPDCPPGAEGYEDSVCISTMKSKTPGPRSHKGVPGETSTEETKAEDEFNKHLNSLLINVEDGSTRRMVERRGRDVAGKWCYLCYPCAATCAGESVMQAHISGKKHKSKIGSKTMWPLSLFDGHPYLVVEKEKEKDPAGKNKKANALNSLDDKYEQFRSIRCHIQEAIDKVGTPMLGLEYLVEHPPEQEHYEPQYVCTLCQKHGYPRTIVNHMTSFWHRYKYLSLHFQKVHRVLTPYRQQPSCREAVLIMINRLAQRIEEKFGRLRPLHIEKDFYEREKSTINKWISNSYHVTEKSGHTFEEVVDVNLIESLMEDGKRAPIATSSSKEPSPPRVAAPSRPRYRNANRRERRISVDSLSDISDEPVDQPVKRDREAFSRKRPSPAKDKESRAQLDAVKLNMPTSFRSRYSLKNDIAPKEDKKLANNLDYKKTLAKDHSAAAEDLAKKTLAYHEKNPEKHPLYPEEWKKFWNRRYKELQSEGKDPTKHDFKSEWIVYWTARMKELHQEELRIVIHEIYRKLCMTPPGDTPHSPEHKRKSPPYRRKSPDYRRHPPDFRRKSPDFKRKAPDFRRMSPDHRRKSPDFKRKSPDYRRKSPDYRRKSPDLRRKLPESRRKSPDFQPRAPEFRRDERRRSMERRHSPDIRRHPEARHRSPERHSGWVSRSPSRNSKPRSRSPHVGRSPVRLNLPLDSGRSASPLSRREASLRNRSPAPVEPTPSMQTVLISDEELEDPKLSPWNSDTMDSLGSLPDARSPVRKRSRSRSVAGSTASRREPPRAPAADLRDLGPAENVVATLRLLVALEDYLGSLGPKIVDLLTEALKMEKEKANSSEGLLENEAAVVLMETAKEKLKGAVQAGLVASAAAGAVRAAVVRVATTLHEADKRARKRPPAHSLVPGVGQVDRAHIAQQMAAALIAQGRTDVSSEELAQLVDAVVGMAEAKKREALEKSEANKTPMKEQKNTASALQMLQSAYDENDKKLEKDEAADAMDGLSDSDLETLLKNFNELSAEEQHSLIAYLKKLEAREPQRVERLRQYVNIASTSSALPPAAAVVSALSVAPTATVVPTSTVATVTAVPDAPKAVVTVASTTDTVHIDSDDDDYTVEEVFNTAKQKVKESQIEQEMEIVKKSLEESKSSKVEPTGQVEMSTSSATNLLAMVQASLQTISAAQTPKPTVTSKPDVVTSNIQPRLFGDLPVAAPMDSNAPSTTQNVPMNPRIDFQTAPMNQSNFNRNTQIGQPSWDSRPMNDNRDTAPVDYGNNNADNNNSDHTPADWNNTNVNAEQSYPSNNNNNALDNRGNNSDNWQNTSNNDWGNNQSNDDWENAPDNDWGNNTNPNNNNWGNNPNPNNWESNPNPNPNNWESNPNPSNNNWGNNPNLSNNNRVINPNPSNNNWENNPNPNNSNWGNNPNSNWGPNNNNRGGQNSWGNAPPSQAQANWRNDNLGQNSSHPYHSQNQRGNFQGGNQFVNQNNHGRGNFRGGRGMFRGRGRGRK